MVNSSPFHSGERDVQALAGTAGQSEAVGRVIAKRIMPGAWEFLAAQSFLVLGSWDGERGAWPSIMFGTKGFATTTDGTSVTLALERTWPAPQEPLWKNLQHNGLMSLLAIELPTRRRLRINGHLSSFQAQPSIASHLDLIVDQAYPNCPKYIQRRSLHPHHFQPPDNPEAMESAALNADQSKWITDADTCFVASVHRESGTDVSHRGGLPGFIQVESATRLKIPDYAGNGMFNTLGNIRASGFAGLLFIDFDHGRQLQVIGDAQIDWSRESKTAERSWLLEVNRVRESSLPHGLQWDFLDSSPFNPTPRITS